MVKLVDSKIHSRISSLHIPVKFWDEYRRLTAAISPALLAFKPIERFKLAAILVKVLGADVVKSINHAIRNPEKGAVIIACEDAPNDDEDFLLRWATGLGYCVGLPNFDSMSGKYFAKIEIKDTFNSDSFLFNGYRPFEMHTDGTFVDEKTDWLLFIKLLEKHVIGGESKLLHINDLANLSDFVESPFASKLIKYTGTASKNVAQPVFIPTFVRNGNDVEVAFNPTRADPESFEDAQFIANLEHAIEESRGICHFELKPGELYFINNKKWLHGRGAFNPSEHLERSAIRMRGSFFK